MDKMMNEEGFWEVISKIDWQHEDDDDRMAPAINFLAKKSEEEIVQFAESFAYKLYQLDTKVHAKNIGEDAYVEGEYFSDDMFLYVRCCVLANGKDMFERVLKDPTAMPKDMDFEPLLYLVPDAFEEKTGDEFDSVTAYDYETGSNEEGWK